MTTPSDREARQHWSRQSIAGIVIQAIVTAKGTNAMALPAGRAADEILALLKPAFSDQERATPDPAALSGEVGEQVAELRYLQNNGSANGRERNAYKNAADTIERIAISSPGVPAGMVMVPRKPTRAMLEEAEFRPGNMIDCGVNSVTFDFRKVWKSMLETAPVLLSAAPAVADVGGASEASDLVLGLRQSRYALRDYHSKQPGCGFDKLALACEQAADIIAYAPLSPRSHDADVRAIREACAAFVESWNGTTRTGDTFHIAEALRELPLPIAGGVGGGL